MWIDLGLNIIIVVLLGVAVFYMVRLSRQISQFKSGREDFERTSHQLIMSTEGVKAALAGMRTHAEETGRALQDKIDEAQKLFDELKFINEAGNSLANRLEKLAEKANISMGVKAPEDLTKGKEPVKKQEKSDIIKEKIEAKKPKSKAEEALMAALKKKKG